MDKMFPSDTRIYICTHTDFTPAVRSPIYEVCDARDINNDMCDNGLRGAFYSELFNYKYLAHCKDLPKYVGVCGYRKYFSFLDDVPDIPSILQEYYAIAPTPVTLPRTIRENHAMYANMEDLDVLSDIIRYYYPDMWEDFDKSLDTNTTYAYNMFIMKRDDFINIVNTIFSILAHYIAIVGKDIEGRIASNPKAYHIGERGFLTPQYQYRIGGFLGERITNAILRHCGERVKHYDVIITQPPIRTWIA